ncbi:MAG: cytochrome c peroxidase [Bacteroidota bacterium]
MNKSIVLLALACLAILIGCTRDDLRPRTEKLTLPDTPYDYTVDNPWNGAFFFDNTPPDNILTDDGATLGRVLFHDKRLSKSNRIACASCHVQHKAFGDDVAKSDGFVNDKTRRNSMVLVNLRHKPTFFWDERESILEDQVMQPISDHIEMGLDDEELIAKLNELYYYPDLFEKAFGDADISLDRISKAIAQYMRSLQSFTSKWDEGNFNNFEDYTASELNGKSLFFEKLHCATCHSGPDLRGWGSANIGLDLVYEDNGIGEWSFGDGMFSIPTLKNIAKSGPYMHDGRFETLEEVIDHYIDGIEPHDFLDFRLRFGDGWGSINFPNVINDASNSSVGDPLRLNLTSQEKQDLINFLHTLTDVEMMTDPKFSDPFSYE